VEKLNSSTFRGIYHRICFDFSVYSSGLYLPVTMKTAAKTENYQASSYLNKLSYLALYVLFVTMIFSVLISRFELQQQVDWILVGIYKMLAALSFFFFIVIDSEVNRFKSRAMPIGFLLGFVALMLMTCSFIFVIPGQWSWYLAGIMLIAAYMVNAYGLTIWTRHHAKKQQAMLHESMTDELTGLFNRRAFAINSARELKFSTSSNSDFSVLILDIDDFKPINDQYGHAVGDQILQQLSQLMCHYVRSADSVYRWGGEEFVILMPVTGLFEANKVAQKLISKVADTTFQVDYDKFLKMTISIGLAQWVEDESLVNDTLKRADKALYKAKENGKNNVVVADYVDSHNPVMITKKAEEQLKSAYE
jgi:diguanylate cyclase (GGDEF)-like protein